MTAENSYAVKVAAILEDGVTPGLLRIIDNLKLANAAMLEFSSGLRNISRASISIGRNLKTAAVGAQALGDSASGLTRSSYILDTMVSSSSLLAKNLRDARAASLGMGRIPGGNGAGGSSGSGNEPMTSGDQYGRKAGTAVSVAAMFGLYESSKLQDINLKSAATLQLPMADWKNFADKAKDLEFTYAKQYAFATGGHVLPFAEAILSASRLLRTLPADKQKTMIDAAMPAAALEAKMKGLPLPEAMASFIELAHMSGAYDPKSAVPLFESMYQASLSTDLTLGQITRAAGYALPSIHASGANSGDTLLLLATMMQAGILNTKSGTWLNNMVLNALPNTLGSGLFKNNLQNQALQKLGLYVGNKAQFYKNGVADPLTEVALLAQARLRMKPEEFNAALRRAFGIEGMRAAALFSEPQVIANLHKLADLVKNAPASELVSQSMKTYSTVAKSDQTIANANMTIMNMSSTLMSPANYLLDKTSSFFGWTADFTKRHPLIGGMMDAGIIAGTVGLLGGIWKGGGVAFEAAGKGIVKWIPKIATSIVGLATTLLTNPYVSAILYAGSAGYAAGSGLNWLINKGLSKATGHDASLGTVIYDLFNPGYDPNATSTKTIRTGRGTVVVNNHVYVDGKEVAHHMVGPANNTGTTSMNPGVLRPMPANPARGY